MQKIGLITYQMGVYCLLISTWTRKIKSRTKLTNTPERHIRIRKEISQANETSIVLFSYTSRHWIQITLVFVHQIVALICHFFFYQNVQLQWKGRSSILTHKVFPCRCEQLQLVEFERCNCVITMDNSNSIIFILFRHQSYSLVSHVRYVRVARAISCARNSRAVGRVF